MYTQQRRDEIIARDSAERSGEGGIRQFISGLVSHHGQDGWGYTALYSDFTSTTTFGPGTSRGIPALA